MNYSTEFLSKLTEFEGSYDYMYLDSKGNVTVGKGHLLSTVGAATKLPFEITREIPADPKLPGARPQTKIEKATVEEITKDYETVKKLSKGFLTRAYAKFTKVRLPQTSIDSLLKSELDDIVSQVRSKFSKIDTWPQSAQEAVVDMSFNMGASFFTTWPKFKKAVEEQDWGTASKECRSGDVQTSRNDWRKKQFEDAAAAAKKAARPAGTP